jgi:cyclopropane fatty-acyl-phospholipid synthase-like methyltransferase
MINLKWINKMRQKKDYKSFIGPAKKYDEIGLLIFEMLKKLGLKGHHFFLDIGCGALRVGKYLIPYLHKSHYFGIEPERWLVNEAMENECDKEKMAYKKPGFMFNSDFAFDKFEKKFNYILANSIFIHASWNQINLCIEKLKEVMKEESVFVFNFIPGKMNKNSNWNYPGAITYPRDEIVKLFDKHGFNCVEFDYPYPGKQIWMIADLKENK